MARPPLDGGTVLITGASSGIGREIARQLAGRARALVLVARRTDRLEELKRELVARHPSLAVHVEGCDVGDRASLAALVDRVQSRAGDVDVLVNNAGLGDMGVFDRASWEKCAQQLAVNVEGLTYLTHRLVPGMVARGRGGVLNVSSGFGLTFLPGFAVYIGTKHYVTGFTEALRLDLSGTGVAVTQVCPGPVATEFEQNVGNFTGQKIPSFVEISPERCARVALRGFSHGRALVVPGAIMTVLTFLAAITPRWVQRLMYGPVARLLRRRQLAAVNAPAAPRGALPPPGPSSPT